MEQNLTSAVTTAPIDSSWTDRAVAVLPPMLLTAWTFLVWIGRIRNVMIDDELSGSGRAARLVLAFAFVGLALAVTVFLVRFVAMARVRGYSVVRQLGVALAVFGIAVWSIRAIGILLDSYGIGFKVVHTLLALATIGLGAHVLRWTAATR